MNSTNSSPLLAGVFLLLATLAQSASSAQGPSELTTIAEQSGLARTGRYDEVERLCAAFAARWPGKARCFEFGRSPEGRPLLALAVSDDGVLDPESARAHQRPVVSSRAASMPARSTARTRASSRCARCSKGEDEPRRLRGRHVLFVPVFNVDGHERFGAWNRPNQRGPVEMGWRVTAQNLNLNRDYAKAEAPEMRALLGLVNAWDPILYADLHVTDGAELREDLSVEVEPGHGWDLELGRTGHALRDDVLARLTRKGFHALPFYPSFVGGDDPDSGLAVGVGLTALQHQLLGHPQPLRRPGRDALLAGVPATRAATRETIHAMVELAARDGVKWLEGGTRGG